MTETIVDPVLEAGKDGGRFDSAFVLLLTSELTRPGSEQTKIEESLDAVDAILFLAVFIIFT